MTLTVPGLIVLIVIAAICGAVGKALAGGARGGLLVSVALGFIGALFGQTFPILWSIIGAAVFVALLHLVSGRTFARN